MFELLTALFSVSPLFTIFVRLPTLKYNLDKPLCVGSKLRVAHGILWPVRDCCCYLTHRNPEGTNYLRDSFETSLLCDGEFLRVRIDFESIQLAFVFRFVFKFSVLYSNLFPNLLLFSESQHPEIKVSLALVLLFSSVIGPDTKPLT